MNRRLHWAGLLLSGLCCAVLRGEETTATPPAGPGEAASTTLYLVRHAEAYKSVPPTGEAAGKNPDSLTPHGEKQAEALGAYLKDKNVAAVVASPLNRTQQTAGAITRALGWKDPPTTNKVFAAMDGSLPMDAVTQQITRELDKLIQANSGKSFVVVTHGDICGLILGLAEKEVASMGGVPPGSVTEIRIAKGAWKIERPGFIPEEPAEEKKEK